MAGRIFRDKTDFLYLGGSNPIHHKDGGTTHRKPAYPVFKPYTIGQPSLIPPSWDELILEKHVVRVVNRAIDKM